MSRQRERFNRWRRRLHVERLELRAAPGVLLATAGFGGSPLADWRSPAADSSADPSSAGEPETQPSESRASAAVAELKDASTRAPLSQASAEPTRPVFANARPTQSALRTPVDNNNLFVRSDEWSALAVELAVARASAAETPAAPLLQQSTLPDAPAFRGSSGGGGGASSSGGGGAGSGGRAVAAGASASTGAAFDQAAAAANQPAPASAPAASEWNVPTGIGQCKPPAGSPAAVFDNATADGLQFVDAAGNPLAITLDGDTLVIGAATWCGNTAKVKAQLSTPEAQEALAGLRVVWAFGDEGGAGPGGVVNAQFLEGLPGDVAFLGASSVRPDRYPSAFNGATGQFDIHALDGIESWLARQSIGQAVPERPLSLVDAGGAPVALAHDANTLVIAAATWCPHCARLKAELAQPEVRQATNGLRIIFAFTNEGGAGPGGVVDADYLAGLPGEVAFLAADSVQPPSFPSAYNPLSGQFDADAQQSIINWLANNRHVGQAVPDASQSQAQPALHGGSGGSTLVGDFNGDNRVDAADYVVWRDTYLMTGPDLAADADGNEVVDELDYDAWKAHFGNELLVPGAFTITGPVGIQTEEDNVVTWTESENATSYRFRLSIHPDLSFPIYNTIETDTSKAVNVGNGTYYIGVTAINATGETVADNQGFSFTVQLPPVDQLIFVTTLRYFVSATNSIPPAANSFGSASAADFHCTAIAHTAGLLDEPWDFQKIHFNAIVTEGSAGVITRTGLVDDQYYNSAGQIVANSRADLLSGTFLAPIRLSDGGFLPGVQPVWTGALPDGSVSGSNCNNWSDPLGGTAHAGQVSGVGTNWLSQGTVSCSSQQRLYCVGNAGESNIILRTFDDLPVGSQAPADYVPEALLGPGWNVADDDLGGQLQFIGNYANLTQPVTTLTSSRAVTVALPRLVAGPAGLAGITVTIKNFAGTVVDTVIIPGVDPGQSREDTTIPLYATNVTTYEFHRVENPNAPGAPAPIDSLSVFRN